MSWALEIVFAGVVYIHCRWLPDVEAGEDRIVIYCKSCDVKALQVERSVHKPLNLLVVNILRQIEQVFQSIHGVNVSYCVRLRGLSH